MFVLFNIPLDEVLSGGPRKDGIPSIDHPKFLLSPEVDYLEDEDLGILLTVNRNTRFYPYKIMSWHEIVVTYCPLCASGVAFSRLISSEVSGDINFPVTHSCKCSITHKDRNSGEE